MDPATAINLFFAETPVEYVYQSSFFRVRKLPTGEWLMSAYDNGILQVPCLRPLCIYTPGHVKPFTLPGLHGADATSPWRLYYEEIRNGRGSCRPWPDNFNVLDADEFGRLANWLLEQERMLEDIEKGDTSA